MDKIRLIFLIISVGLAIIIIPFNIIGNVLNTNTNLDLTMNDETITIDKITDQFKMMGRDTLFMDVRSGNISTLKTTLRSETGDDKLKKSKNVVDTFVNQSTFLNTKDIDELLSNGESILDIIPTLGEKDPSKSSNVVSIVFSIISAVLVGGLGIINSNEVVRELISTKTTSNTNVNVENKQNKNESTINGNNNTVANQTTTTDSHNTTNTNNQNEITDSHNTATVNVDDRDVINTHHHKNISIDRLEITHNHYQSPSAGQSPKRNSQLGINLDEIIDNVNETIRKNSLGSQKRPSLEFLKSSQSKKEDLKSSNENENQTLHNSTIPFENKRSDSPDKN